MPDKGAIVAFQSDNNLDMDGVAGPAFWAQLFKAVAQDKQNPSGYTYSLVSQRYPERLRVYTTAGRSSARWSAPACRGRARRTARSRSTSASR